MRAGIGAALVRGRAVGNRVARGTAGLIDIRAVAVGREDRSVGKGKLRGTGRERLELQGDDGARAQKAVGVPPLKSNVPALCEILGCEVQSEKTEFASE